MSEFFQHIFNNVTFSIQELCVLKCVDKYINCLASNSIDFARSNQSINPIGKQLFIKKIQPDICHKCNKRRTHRIYPFFNVPSCFDCKEKNTCSSKDAKLKYMISNEYLKSIDYYYKNGKKNYSLIHIMELSVLKNIDIRKHKVSSLAKMKRSNQIKKIESLYVSIPKETLKDLIESYVNNGKEGIRRFRLKLDKCALLISQLLSNNIDLKYFDIKRFIELDNNTVDVCQIQKRILECNKYLLDVEKQQYVTFLDSNIYRKNILLNILEGEGFEDIEFIVQSNICKSYILGYSKSTSIQDIVEKEKDLRNLLDNIKHHNIIMKSLKRANNIPIYDFS